jgi:CheY-like chemotaxis protein/glycine cleavage system H lipoate-binding protein
MKKRERILVVDDDPVIAQSCKRILSSEGYVVSVAEKGEEAINKVSKEEFSLVITDIRLPDIYGLIVLKETKVIQPESDVVVITGYPSLEDAKESVRLGAFEYIEKPFTPEFIINTAKKVFDRRGWILRKAYIDQFRYGIVPSSELDERTIYYKEGTWARPLREDYWEIGIDVRYWFLAGQLLYLELPEGLKALASGEPFCRLLTGGGQIFELPAPMTGVVKEINERANDIMCSLTESHLSEGWLLWVVRIEPIK